MLKKSIYLLLAVSLGINAGLLAMTLLNRTPAAPPSWQQPPGGEPGGPGGPPPGQHPGPPPDPQHMIEQHVTSMTRHLDLDSEQQHQIRAILEREAPRLIELQRIAEGAGRHLTEAYAAPDFDPAAFRRLVTEASAARAAVDSLSAVMLVAEAAVLTPEQRIMFAEVAPVVHANPRQAPQPREQGDRPPPRH